MLFTTDMLPHICEHLTCFAQLSTLACVNKALRDHIHHFSHEHWLRIGRETCGKAYWNEALFAHTLDRPDGRYTAKLHMCPWLSAPERFQLRTLDAYSAMDTTVELKSLKIKEDPMECSEPLDNELHLRIRVHDSPHAKGGQRVITRCARDGDASDSLHVVEDMTEIEEYTDDTMLEIDILVHLENDHAFRRFARRYGLGDLACVRIVHEQMFAAIFDEGRTWRHSTVLFISMNDHTRILHDLRLTDSASECVAFRPGEMWYAQSSGSVRYHGPRADRRIEPYTLQGHGRISRAFFAAVNGRADEAVRLLAPLNIEDLSEIYAPKTTLSLFDIAADPDGRAMHARDMELFVEGSAMDMKADTAILDHPLPSDAAYLLRVEPRFATGVHMMKRAIRAMDTHRVRALAAAGCPWVSHDDVVDALPPGIEYEEAMGVLRQCGLRITFRY